VLFNTPVYPMFLVAVLAVYWASSAERRRDVLTLASLLLLTYLTWRGTVLFLVLCGYVYLLGHRLRQGTLNPRDRTRVLTAALVVPICYLATFKYLPDYAPPIRAMLQSITSGELILPLGISFFTFKFIHYVIECRRRTLPPHGFADFLAYVSLFTTFAAGPIDRFGSIAPQFSTAEWRPEQFAEGLRRILFGMVKKIVLADLVVQAAIEGIGNVPADPGAYSAAAQFAWLWCSLLLIYFDFSGYSDIAIGTSHLFGLRVMENFNSPLIRRNLSDFWRSWHISLSSWCRDYVYFPVFGATRNPKVAVYASMLVLGYWHGGNPKWLCWGAWHASGLAVWQLWQVWKRKPALTMLSRRGRLGMVSGWLLTVNFVAVGAVWTSTDDPVAALRYLYYMFIG